MIWTCGAGVRDLAMFFTKAGRVIESFLKSRRDILLKN